MPASIPKPCRFPGCPNRTISNKGYCQKHLPIARKKRKFWKNERPHQKCYNRQWSKVRKQFLLDNPLCCRCLELGCIETATVVDHIIPHRGDTSLFWDNDNWQALCKRCHDKKTASEDRLLKQLNWCEFFYLLRVGGGKSLQGLNKKRRPEPFILYL